MGVIDHNTFQVEPNTLGTNPWSEFTDHLELLPIAVEEKVPDGWKVEWYEDSQGSKIHFVEVPGVLSPFASNAAHVCIVVKDDFYRWFKNEHTSVVERDSGSGRLWLSFRGFRVELRAQGQAVQPTGVDVLPEPPSASPQRLADHHGAPAAEPLRPTPNASLIRAIEKVVKGEAAAEGEEIDPQLDVLIAAYRIYYQREKKYKGHWKRYGWRGALAEMRKAAERAWHLLWDSPDVAMGPDDDYSDLDDLLDVINYAAFSYRAVEEGNRDGEGGWW